MSARKASPEKSLQLYVDGLPSNFNVPGFQGGIKYLNNLWAEQGSGTLFYLFGRDFFLLIPYSVNIWATRRGLIGKPSWFRIRVISYMFLLVVRRN